MGLYSFIQKSQTKTQESYFDVVTKSTGVSTSSRPSDGFLSVNKDSETLLAEKMNVIRYTDLWNLSRVSDVLQITFNTRARKTFRGGFDIEPLYESADTSQKERIEHWIKRCNSNGQSLKEVNIELDKDLNWADDAYMLCLKDYGYNSAGEIIKSDVKEFVRLHPLSVAMVLDSANRLGRQDADNDEESIVYVNPFNRGELTTKRYNSKGQRNIQAHYKVQTTSGIKYYNSSEIMHKSAYNPSLTYGYSPLFSLYQKVMILMLQDSYIKKYYGDDKPTKGLLVFNTSNKDALMKTFDEIRIKTQKNPHSVKPIIAESSDGRKPVEYIDMAKTLDEMQFSDNRQEIRQQIGAMYGVSPMFQNDMSTGGGLNNEGLQATVTNEVIQDRQDLFNNSFVDFVFRQNLGFTDYKVTIKPDIEQDLMAEQQLKAQELANAKTKLELGLKGRMDKHGKIIFDQGELELQDSQAEQLSPFQLGESITKAEPVKVTKSSKKEIQSQTKVLENKMTKELKSILEKLDFSKMPSEEELFKKLSEVDGLIDSKLKKTASSVFKGIYEKFAKETSKQVGTKYVETDADKQMIKNLKKDPLYLEAFSNVSKEVSDNIKKTIMDSYGKKETFTLDKLIEDIQEQTELAKNRVSTIARTETTKLGIASQQKQLEKTGATYKYFHRGIKDKRTGKDTLELMELTKNGVSWEEYKQLAKKVAKKFNPKWEVSDIAPILHPNQRSRPLFRRVREEQ